MNKRFDASISYDIDMVVDDEAQDILAKNLESFGARNIKVVLKPWTGAGEHEFVGSNIPGLEGRAVCIKCTKTRDDAPEKCAGIPVTSKAVRK